MAIKKFEDINIKKDIKKEKIKLTKDLDVEKKLKILFKLNNPNTKLIN